jgi:NitT/TauT family transport system permease protein
MNMDKEHQRIHHHRHFSVTYPVSVGQKLYSIFLTPIIIVVIIVLAVKIFSIFPGAPLKAIEFTTILKAFVYTFGRLSVAFILALIIAIPLALIADVNVSAEKILLPMFDIIQSVPVLAFFPIIIAVFVKYSLFDWAAIFILFLGMLWNLVFSLIGGLRVIPNDIKSAARVFNIRGFSYFRKILLPASVPYLTTGSILAWAQGWNIIIVAEVLHTYLPGGVPSQDLFGIGSMLVNAAATSQQALFISAIVIMVIGIGLINFFVWQRLLHYAERFKFE